MPTFTCKFYLASDLLNETQTHSCRISEQAIGTFGQLFSETLILQTGRHFTYYRGSKSAKAWRVSGTYSGRPVAGFRKLMEKVRAQAVSGNIGEAIAFPALTACLRRPLSALPSMRLKSRRKCPDFLLAYDAAIFGALWGPSVQFPSHLTDVPMEVKAALSSSSKFPKKALEQLLEYWKACANRRSAYNNKVGYGIVARVSIQTRQVRYYLFMPAPSTASQSILSATVDDLYNNTGGLFQ